MQNICYVFGGDIMTLDDIAAAVSNCNRCALGLGRINTVPGEGNPAAKLMFVGEGPGEQEDRSGRPFVGAAGMLLDKMIEAIGLLREDVFIANVVKCRPPGNRAPTDDEGQMCLKYLRAQVSIIKPRIIVCLGATAGKFLIGPDFRVTRDRGKWIERKGYLMTATFHPSALLRDPPKKHEAWEDFKAIRDKLSQINTLEIGDF